MRSSSAIPESLCLEDGDVILADLLPRAWSWCSLIVIPISTSLFSSWRRGRKRGKVRRRDEEKERGNRERKEERGEERRRREREKKR